MNAPQDLADQHLDRWEAHWSDDDGRDRETEGALMRMTYVQNASLRGLRALLTHAPLTYDEFITLHQLANGQKEGPFRATPAQLADRGGVTRAAMTGRVDKLLRKGFVTRDEDENDRRQRVIVMTAAGREIWLELLLQWSQLERELLSPLSVEELRQLNDLMRRVALADEAKRS